MNRERELTPVDEAGRPAPAGANVPQSDDPDQLVQDIEETRAELGETVDALAQKADVKARVSEKVEQRKLAWRERQDDVKTRLSGARGRVADATPADARRVASQVEQTAKDRPGPAIVVALALGLLIGRTLGRR